MLAGTGLTGGGTIAANRTFAIGNTGVTAASYGNASNVGRFTVNAQGQITGASSVPIVITSSFISNFTEAVQDLLSTTLVAGTGISLAYNDAGGLLTITANNVGTVTSVAASAPVSGFTISGSPITSSGTLVFTLNNDLLALENISTLGYAVRTATNT